MRRIEAIRPETVPSSWWRALNLLERDELVRCARGANNVTVLLPADLDAARVTQELWSRVPSVAGDTGLIRLLRAYGMTADGFKQVLATPAAALIKHLPEQPAWLAFALAARARARNRSDGHRKTAFEDPWLEKAFYPLQDIVDEGLARLRDFLTDCGKTESRIEIDRELVTDAFHDMVHQTMLNFLIKPFVIELHIARRSGELLLGTPADRFAEFVDLFASPEFQREFMERYPVLRRLATTHVSQAVSSIRELLDRVGSDVVFLKEKFGLEGRRPRLDGLEFGLGDPHRAGRTVTKLTFNNGVTIVYKPRSLRIDLVFRRILGTIAADLDVPGFWQPTVLDRGVYGYMQYVDTYPCSSTEELGRFFYRHGAQLALLYVLGGTDVHFENVLAAGEHPVLVDLETLMAPHFQIDVLCPVEQHAVRSLMESVLGSGLLPHRIRFDRTLEAVDVSGLSAFQEKGPAVRIPIWRNVGTDEMHLERSASSIIGGKNSPTADRDVDLYIYTENIERGLEDAFLRLAERRKEIDEIVSASDEIPVRFIFRNTYDYALVLQESYHPFHLGDAIDRDRHFDYLLPSWTIPKLEALYRYEREDLWRNDVPIFTARPGSHSLWSSTGTEITSVFEETGLDGVRRRLASMSRETLAREKGYVRASMTAAASSRHDRTRAFLSSPCTFHESPLEMATAIAERICNDAFLEGDAATWITVNDGGIGVYEHVLAGDDLYSGLPGLILFLVYAGAACGELRFTNVARAGISTLLKRPLGSPGRRGAFEGPGGIVYALTHAAVILDEPALLEESEQYLEMIAQVPNSDPPWDVVGGVAGCLLSVLAFHEAHGGSAPYAAQVCGDLVRTHVARAFTHEEPVTASVLVSGGFGHGLIGAVYALHELERTLGREDGAGRTNALDRALAQIGRIEPDNWMAALTDLPDTWCRGLSGLLSALTRMLPYDDGWLSEVVDVASTAPVVPETGSHCLCHGALGNLELVLDAERWSSGRRWREAAALRGDWARRHAAEGGWIGGGPIIGPGLMTGLAGIGYQMLRLVDPIGVPSVLFLEPPRRYPGYLTKVGASAPRM